MGSPFTLTGMGQSLWLENATREHLQSGLLVQQIRENGVTGASLRVRACGRFLRHTEVYDAAIRKKLGAGLYGEPLALELLLEDARLAADLLRPVHDRTAGVDGWVSLEICPPPAAETVALATAMHAGSGRPNILIALPGAPDYLKAIEEAVFRGVPVNIACLLSREQFLGAARAYLRGIERRIAAGRNPALTSFASVPISRLAAALCRLSGQSPTRGIIAVSRRIYQAARELHTSQEWERAYNAGARPLRLVWAMETGDVNQPLHAEILASLMAPLTVAALPEHLLQAVAGRDCRGEPMPANGGDSEGVLSGYRQRGIDPTAAASSLQPDEVKALIASWIDLLDAIAGKSASLSDTGRR